MKQFDFCLDYGDRNKGTVYLPDSLTKPIPVAIFCHGWGGCRTLGSTPQEFCNRLVECGAALVAVDLYGCGETGGDYSLFTYKRWKENISDVISWIFKQDWANPERIGCFSISSGTSAAFRLAEEDRRVAFVISIGTCISSHFGMGDGGPGRLLIENFDALLNGGTVKLFNVDFGIDFYKDAVGNAAIYRMDQIKCPVLFLQGSEDNIYRKTDALIGYEKMKKKGLPAKYVLLEGGDHGLDKVADRCAEESIDWLREIEIVV